MLKTLVKKTVLYVNVKQLKHIWRAPWMYQTS